MTSRGSPTMTSRESRTWPTSRFPANPRRRRRIRTKPRSKVSPKSRSLKKFSQNPKLSNRKRSRTNQVPETRSKPETKLIPEPEKPEATSRNLSGPMVTRASQGLKCTASPVRISDRCLMFQDLSPMSQPARTPSGQIFRVPYFLFRETSNPLIPDRAHDLEVSSIPPKFKIKVLERHFNTLIFLDSIKNRRKMQQKVIIFGLGKKLCTCD